MLPVTKIVLKTYRFVFSNQMIEYLSEFSKIHQYDDRKTFKEEWEKWIKDEDVAPIINEEIKRLTNQGFEGDILDKMFKSTRYYFRNKQNTNIDEKKTPRKTYETVPIDILEKIDEHIHSQIRNYSNKILDSECQLSSISPAESFNNYLKENKIHILQQLQESNIPITKSEVEKSIKKYKKTYKNRFYNIRVSLNN